MSRIVRAISIRQPIVELVLQGRRKVEERNWPTNIRERVYLYAPLQPSDWPYAWAKMGKLSAPLPMGVIVGSVEIVGCRWNGRTGRYEYQLRAPRRLRTPLLPVNHPQPVFWRPKFR